MSKLAKIYEQIRKIVDNHDGGGCRSTPPGKATGVMMAYADIERVGLEEGELVYPSKNIRVESGGQYGNIRVICDANCHKRAPSGLADPRPTSSHEERIVVADSEPQRAPREREFVEV